MDQWRERRRVSPYLLSFFPSDPTPALWVRKPALRFFPPGERARRSACLPPRRWTSMSFVKQQALFHKHVMNERTEFALLAHREINGLSRLFGSMNTTAKCVSMGPAHCRERLQNTAGFSSASIQRGESHSGGPRAGSGNGTRSRVLS